MGREGVTAPEPPPHTHRRPSPGGLFPWGKFVQKREKPLKAESPVCCTEVVWAVSVCCRGQPPAPPEDLVAQGQASGPSQAGRAELRAPSHSPGPPGAPARGPPVRLTLPPSAPHGRVGVPRAARLCVSSGFLHRPCSAWEAGRTSAGRPQPRKLSVGARGPWGGSSARDVLCSPGTAVSDAAREPRRARPEGTALGSPGSFCVRAGRPGGRPRSQAPRGGWRGHRSLAVGSSFPAHVLAFFFFPLFQ